MSIILLVLPLAALDEAKPADRVPAATALLEALVKEDFEAAARDFDDTMKMKSPPDKMKEFWKEAKVRLGALKKRGEARTEKSKDYDIVYIPCEFEKTSLDLKVSFDRDGKVAGFFFVPPRAAYKFEPPPYAKADAFTEEAVTVGEGEWALPGTVTLPKGDGPFPAAVLVHGSGPNDRDETLGPNKPFRDLAWGLASRGVAVLRYEKRTREYGPKMLKIKDQLTLKEEVLDDALAAAALLRRHKGVDRKRVFLVGHSLGALAGPRLAESDPALAGVALLAAPSRRLEDVIVDQFTYIFSLNGDLSDKDKEELEKIKKQAEKVKDPKLTAETPSAELPLGMSAAYWLALREYDAPATAAKLTVPVLILQGERDYQVTTDDFEGWKKALASRKNAVLKSYPKLNHLFMEGQGKARPAEYEKAGHVAEEVVSDLAEWIKKG
jgi:dienelactone hydrolase